MNKRIISFVYRILLTISLSTGIILNVMRTTSISAILSYYTLQSNIICLVVFVAILVVSAVSDKYQESDVYYLVKGGITIAIAITGLVYAIALGPIGFEMNINTNGFENFMSNFLVHRLSPILVILDYFFFDKKGKFKFYYPFIWLIIPLNYLIYVYAYSSKGGEFFGIGGSRRFAYIFLDYTKIGYQGVTKAIVIMGFTILLISFILVIVDRILGRSKGR